MITIYQVVGKLRSDREHKDWVVASYTEPEHAKEHANILSAFLDHLLGEDIENGNFVYQNLLNKLHPIDRDYDGRGKVTYEVENVEVREREDRQLPNLEELISTFKFRTQLMTEGVIAKHLDIYGLKDSPN